MALNETIWKTMAENPSFFADAAKDSLEVFTEGLGMVIPGVADEATMDRLRGYAHKILETPDDRLPPSIARSRRDIERLLPHWAPVVTSAQALEMLKKGVPPQEGSDDAFAAARARLRPELVAGTGVLAIVILVWLMEMKPF